MVRACVLMMAVLGTGATASTQNGAEPVEREVVPAEENAALQYWAIWSAYPPEHWYHVRLQLVCGLRNDTEPDPNAELLNDVSGMWHCDFGVSGRRGYRSGLRHIDVMRDLTDLLLLDAEVLLRSDRAADAADRVAAAIRLCEHQTQTALVPSALGAADRIYAIASFIAHHQERWDQTQRQRISWALGRFDATDPLHAAETVLRQADFDTDACMFELRGGVLDPAEIRRAIEQNQAGDAHPIDIPAERQMADFWVELISTLGPNGADDEKADEESRRILRSALSQGRAARIRIAWAWMSVNPTPEEYEKRVFQWIEESEYSEVSRAFVQSVAPLRPRSFETAELIATLRAWASGETETLELPEEDES